MKNFALIYLIGFTIATLIFSYRAYKNKQSVPVDYLDVIFWLFGWWFLLPIFIVRWIKYKLKGENI